jgi:glycosyltransferase 2 family protein
MTDTKANESNLKRNLLVLIGTALGLFFLYLAFRDISWSELVGGVKRMEVVYLLPSVILLCLIQFVRAARFALIISPFCKPGIKNLWDVMNIWAAASMILPARLGELARPYLLRQNGAAFSSTIGALVVERIFDLSALLFLAAVVLWTTPEIPRQYAFWGEVLFGAWAAGYGLILLMLAQRERVRIIMERVLSFLPARIAAMLGGILHRVLDGLGIMASFKQAILIFLFSLFLWLVFSVMTYLFLLAFDIRAPFLVAVTIQVFICFGVVLPTAPGFIGTFHAAVRYACAVFGIQAVTAVSLATVYHLFSFVMCLVLGLISYLTSTYHFDHGLLSGPDQGSSSSPESVEGTGRREYRPNR